MTVQIAYTQKIYLFHQVAEGYSKVGNIFSHIKFFF